MKSLTAVLLDWYSVNKRDLPWRRTRDPYLVWLSEIILQQTRVSQGLSYYMRFAQRFPSPRALADAPEDEVLKCWQGLGYYSRARNLHAAAKSMDGVFPSTYEGVRALKGVGDYTAAAICSIAYQMPYAVVDGNVYRVLARVFAISTPIDSPAGKKQFTQLAQKLLDKQRPGDYNQAIMDFGAMVCTPLAPQCEQCPLAGRCQAYALGKVEQLPVKMQKNKISTRYFHYIYVRQGTKTWLHKRGAGDVWQNLYEPPLVESDSSEEAWQKGKEYKKLFGRKEASLAVAPVKHVLSHRVIWADLSMVEVSPRAGVPQEFVAVEAKDVKKYAVSRLVQKLLEKAGLL